MERDKEVNQKLEEEQWEVLRFWGKDIKKNLQNCLDIIEEKINEAKGKNIN